MGQVVEGTSCGESHGGEKINQQVLHRSVKLHQIVGDCLEIACTDAQCCTEGPRSQTHHVHLFQAAPYLPGWPPDEVEENIPKSVRITEVETGAKSKQRFVPPIKARRVRPKVLSLEDPLQPSESPSSSSSAQAMGSKGTTGDAETGVLRRGFTGKAIPAPVNVDAVAMKDPRFDDGRSIGIVGFSAMPNAGVCDDLCEARPLRLDWDVGARRISLHAPVARGACVCFRNAKAAFAATRFWPLSEDFSGLTATEALEVEGKLRNRGDEFFAGFGGKWQAMLAVLRAKFCATSHEALCLMETQDSYILCHHIATNAAGTYNAQESTEFINFWTSGDEGEGGNFLGIQLMLVRDAIRGKEDWTKYFKSFFNIETGTFFDQALSATFRESVRIASSVFRGVLPGCPQTLVENKGNNAELIPEQRKSPPSELTCISSSHVCAVATTRMEPSLPRIAAVAHLSPPHLCNLDAPENAGTPVGKCATPQKNSPGSHSLSPPPCGTIPMEPAHVQVHEACSGLQQSHASLSTHRPHSQPGNVCEQRQPRSSQATSLVLPMPSQTVQTRQFLTPPGSPPQQGGYPASPATSVPSSAGAMARASETRGREIAGGHETLVEIARQQNASLGLDFESSDAGMEILAVTGGHMAEWNARNAVVAIGCGDRIVEVNGIRGSGRQLVNEIKQSRNLAIKFVKPWHLPTTSAVMGRSASSSSRGSRARSSSRDDIAELAFTDLERAEELAYGALLVRLGGPGSSGVPLDNAALRTFVLETCCFDLGSLHDELVKAAPNLRMALPGLLEMMRMHCAPEGAALQSFIDLAGSAEVVAEEISSTGLVAILREVLGSRQTENNNWWTRVVHWATRGVERNQTDSASFDLAMYISVYRRAARIVRLVRYTLSR